jgi:hypothetical protein
MYIYNTDKLTYLDLAAYLTSLPANPGDTYRVLFLNKLDDIFSGAKRLTAMRGRFAKDDQGGSNLDKIALTDDEREWFDDEIIKNGSSEVFRKISAWAKSIDEACRHNVKFGDPVQSGAVTGVVAVVVTDATKVMVVNALAGYKMVITSPGALMNQERIIVSNTVDTITLDQAFSSDITGLEYSVFTQTDDFIIYYISLNLTWDPNMLQGVDASIKQALVLYTVKEWYLINRMTDDYTIENVKYENELSKIRVQLMQTKTPTRRPVDFFS